MEKATRPMETLQEIKRMMERSSRFISLSGWSGVSAGICALAGAWVARQLLYNYAGCEECLLRELVITAAVVFVAAFVSAFFFTYLQSRKNGVQIWGVSAMRLLWNTVIPMTAGGVVILKLLASGYYSLLAPCSLVFYGLALVNGSKYTLGEVRHLGYGEIILGLVSLWLPGYGLIFWAIGFGILHIVYGLIMWWKYEKTAA